MDVRQREDGYIEVKHTYHRGEAGFDAPLTGEMAAAVQAFGDVDYVGSLPSDRTPTQYTHTSVWRRK